MLLETFSELVRDPAHWQFELLVGGIEFLALDIIIGALLWPRLHRDIKSHHTSDASVRAAYKKGYTEAMDKGCTRGPDCIRCNEKGMATRGGGEQPTPRGIFNG